MPPADGGIPGGGMLRLFLLPLLVVAIGMAIVAIVSLASGARRTPEECLRDLKSADPSRRGAAAYDLAQILARPGEGERLRRDPAFRRALEAALGAGAKSGWIRIYLVDALSAIGDPASAPALRRVLDDGDAEAAAHAAIALGRLADLGSLEALIGMSRHADARRRKAAVYALRAFIAPAAAARLKEALADSVPGVGWNAALSLSHLGDPAAVLALESMLDRARLAAMRIPPAPGAASAPMSAAETDEILAAAAAGAARLRAPALRPALERLVASDPSARVRDAARRALEAEGREKKSKVPSPKS